MVALRGSRPASSSFGAGLMFPKRKTGLLSSLRAMRTSRLWEAAGYQGTHCGFLELANSRRHSVGRPLLADNRDADPHRARHVGRISGEDGTMLGEKTTDQKDPSNHGTYGLKIPNRLIAGIFL